ncbi:hypothetical protein AAGT01_14020 [Kurthia sp. Hakim RU_BHWE]
MATFIERLAHWNVGVLIPNRVAKSMEVAVHLLNSKLPKVTVKTPWQRI